ncbi:hypothetical protein FALBO_10163, partial [Fusarium albosuccineum]
THVEDVAQVFLKLVEAAAVGGEGAQWNFNGYYFTPNEEISQIEIAYATGKILKAKGLLVSSEPKQITLDELDKQLPEFPPGSGRIMFAANSRAKADRCEKMLDIKAKAPSFLESLEDDLLAAAGLAQ